MRNILKLIWLFRFLILQKYFSFYPNTLAASIQIYCGWKSYSNQACFGCLTNHITPQPIALELFKPSKNLASLQLCNGEKVFVLTLAFGFLVSDVINEVH